MAQQTIRRVRVWSKGVRICHGLLAFSTLILIATAWMMAWSPALFAAAKDFHLLSAYVFSVALLYRIMLLFIGKNTDLLAAFKVASSDKIQIASMLRFYLSVGKMDAPRWFAHNPLWRLAYMIFFVIGLLLVFSGFAIGKIYMGPGISLVGMHQVGSSLVIGFVFLHVIAVILHDSRGDNGISAIISGYKYFIVETMDKSDKNPESVFPIKFHPIKTNNKQNQ